MEDLFRLRLKISRFGLIVFCSFFYDTGGPSSLDSNRLKYYLPHTALHFSGYALNVSRAILGGG